MLIGFDISTAPSPDRLVTLRKNFDFCGCYLAPAPSHPDKSWMVAGILNARRIGFRFLPVFVGQQITGPGSKINTVAQGEIDARQAVSHMASAEFPKSSPVYLDLENGAPFDEPQRSYVFAWIEEVRRLGYTPGVYCSHTFANSFDPDKTRVWAFRVPTTQTTVQVHMPPPLAVTLGKYSALQYRQNVSLPDLGLVVDFNVASPLALAS